MSGGNKFLDFFDLLKDKEGDNQVSPSDSQKSRTSFLDFFDILKDEEPPVMPSSNRTGRVIEHKKRPMNVFEAVAEAERLAKKNPNSYRLQDIIVNSDSTPEPATPRIELNHWQGMPELKQLLGDYIDGDTVDENHIFYGDGESIEREESSESALELHSEKWAKTFYKDNAQLIGLIYNQQILGQNWKGIPTYKQYKKILSLSLERYEHVIKKDRAMHEADEKKYFDKQIRLEDHIKQVLYEFSYGYRGRISGVEFQPVIISDYLLDKLKGGGFEANFTSYNRVIEIIIARLQKVLDRSFANPQAMSSLFNLHTYIFHYLPPKRLQRTWGDESRYLVYIDVENTVLNKGAVCKYYEDGETKYIARNHIDRPHHAIELDKDNQTEYWEYLRSHNTVINSGVLSDPRIDYLLNPREVKIRFPLLEKLQTKYKVVLPRVEQESHSYIIGGTKSGKSELIKFLFVQEVLHGNRNAILLDPHGDIASEIINISFLYPNYTEKIIYIDTSIHKEIGEGKQKLPCINPLEINKKYVKTEEEIEAVADNLILAFEEIVGAENTVNMSSLLKPCLCVLLREDDTTLFDLSRFMDDNRNEDLVEIGKKSPSVAHREFFENRFYSKNRTTTKEALATRLQVALNSSVFVKMTCGKTTVDFHEIMRGKGNTVIFRLDKKNTKAIQKELGILITSTIMSCAFSLDKKERVGTHLFMDEFQNFISKDIENILSECRKYRLYITMAHQYMSQIKDTGLKQGILANSNIKLIGKIGGNAVPFLKNNGENRLEQEDVNQLRTGRFLMRVMSKGADYSFLKVPSVLVNPKWVDLADKKAFLKEQYKKYYKPSKPASFSKASVIVQGEEQSKSTALDFDKF